MTRRWLLLVCCALLVAPAASAQGRGARPDPITGNWTGELVRQDGAPIAVTMQLKFDGKAAVSGTVSGLPGPADVKAGTFDAKTGALKLELGKTGESTVRVTLDGTVAKGAASGRLGGELAGTFKLAKSPKP